MENGNNMEEEIDGMNEKSGSEIDFKAIALRLWEKRKYIIKVFAVFFALGLAAALLMTPRYTATCTFVPQSSSSKNNSSLSSLAAMAGLNLGDMSQGNDLSPLIYPQMLDNVDFMKELMRVPLHYRKYDEFVSIYDVSTDSKYRKFTLATVKKYTVRLPYTIRDAIRGKKKAVVPPVSADGKQLPYFTKEEEKLAGTLKKKVSIGLDKKEGYLTISANMDEPLSSAELCQATFDLLQKYVSEFKLKHARDNYDFIQRRYDEAKSEYEQKQLALAMFTDSNRGLLSATAQIERDKLSSDFNIAYSMFNEMSKQLIQVEMKVKEDTPIFSAVKPVSVPTKRSNSRTKTMIIWLFFGVVVSCGSVLAFDWLKTKGLNWPKKWD